MRIAIVTGASAGLGRDFVLQLDGRSDIDEIWMMARRVERLEELAGSLKKARGRAFRVDLSRVEDIEAFWDSVAAERPIITWLVNNAGMGAMGPFDRWPVETYRQMIDLNCRALTEFSLRALPFMERGSRIVQVGSTAGYRPLANFAAYAATKAFVVSFSQALAGEIADRGISVTCVNPGPVRTEFIDVASRGKGSTESVGFAMAESPDVVRLAIRDAVRGRRTSVYGLLLKLYHWTYPLMPQRLVVWATARTPRKLLGS